jgi:hypothetical protein
MKNVLKKQMFALILLGFMALSQISQAQAPPPPPGTKGGDTNGVPGGGAPIGSGMVLLITLAAGYGGKKVFDAR